MAAPTLHSWCLLWDQQHLFQSFRSSSDFDLGLMESRGLEGDEDMGFLSQL